MKEINSKQVLIGKKYKPSRKCQWSFYTRPSNNN